MSTESPYEAPTVEEIACDGDTTVTAPVATAV